MTATLDPPSLFALAKEASPQNAEATAAVLDVARGWEAGAMPLAQVRTLCNGYDRFVAINHALGPDKQMLMRLFDALTADQDARDGSVQTHHGRFTRADLHEYGGLLLDRNGARVLVWPSLSHDGRFVYGAERVSRG